MYHTHTHIFNKFSLCDIIIWSYIGCVCMHTHTPARCVYVCACFYNNYYNNIIIFSVVLCIISHYWLLSTMCVCVRSMCVYVCVCIYVCMYVCMYVRMCVCDDNLFPPKTQALQVRYVEAKPSSLKVSSLDCISSYSTITIHLHLGTGGVIIGSQKCTKANFSLVIRPIL